MTKLETTLLNLAHQHLAAIVCFLEVGDGGKVRHEDENDYLQSTAALTALLELGHLDDSGMSDEAVKAMLGVEAKQAAALRAANPTGAPVHQTQPV